MSTSEASVGKAAAGMRSQRAAERADCRARRGDAHTRTSVTPGALRRFARRVEMACASPWTLITELRTPLAEGRRRAPPARPTELNARSAGTACAPPSARAPAGVRRAHAEQTARAPVRSEAHPPDGGSRR